MTNQTTPQTATPEYGVTEILNAVDDAAAIELAVVQVMAVAAAWNWLKIPSLIADVMAVLPALQNIATLNLPEFLKEVAALDAAEAQVVANEVAADLKKDGLPAADIIAALVTQVTATYNMVQTWIVDIKKWFHL